MIPTATVAIPTLLADASLRKCMDGLRAQTRRDFEIVVIDNSGRGLATGLGEDVRVLPMSHNVGYGAAINKAFETSSAPFLVTLNDDTHPCPGWFAALVAAAESDSQVGMCASQVLLDARALDSAGMLIYGDGSSKQRGHGDPPESYRQMEEVLFPSASAALYRRAMLDQIGLFDEDFFLYCEDTDLGLRARRAGWRCLYVPEARVEHRYSHSAGRVSKLKAYYVERNRIFVAMKNFPLRMLAALPVYGTARYLAHVMSAFSGSGKSGAFQGGIAGMLGIVLRSHIDLLLASPRIFRQRTWIHSTARISDGEFARLLSRHSTTARALAEH
jgi:GT2 family glycosyltransferase